MENINLETRLYDDANMDHQNSEKKACILRDAGKRLMDAIEDGEWRMVRLVKSHGRRPSVMGGTDKVFTASVEFMPVEQPKPVRAKPTLTDAILQRVESLGYSVESDGIHGRNTSTMQFSATSRAGNTINGVPVEHDDYDEARYLAACHLATAVGIELEE